MKPSVPLRSLMGFVLGNRPWALWVLTVAYLGVLSLSLFDSSSGLEPALHGWFLPVIFTACLGFSLFVGTPQTGDGNIRPSLSHAEFLLSRPVTRRRFYFACALPFLLIIFLPLLALIVLATRHPDMDLSLYHSAKQSTEAFDKLAFYRDQFPDSAILSDTHGQREFLRIPNGLLFKSAWELWLITLAALGTQVVFLAPPPSRHSKWVTCVLLSPFLIPLIFLLFPDFSKHFSITESLFLFFHRHWESIGLATLALLVLVQLFAWKRAKEIEVG